MKRKQRGQNDAQTIEYARRPFLPDGQYYLLGSKEGDTVTSKTKIQKLKRKASVVGLKIHRGTDYEGYDGWQVSNSDNSVVAGSDFTLSFREAEAYINEAILLAKE